MQQNQPADRPLPASDFVEATDPFALFGDWFADAEAHEINDANAMSLATVDSAGMPNVRIVLLKGVDAAKAASERGFTFFTNHESDKGRELLSAGKAALLFYWKSLGRQIRIRGAVAPVSDAEGDGYFASRARGSQIGAWASQQSRPLESRAVLEAAVSEAEARFGDDPVPRPPYWSGFRLVPTEIEFWHDRPFRLHDRVVFRRATLADTWTRTRLYP